MSSLRRNLGYKILALAAAALLYLIASAQQTNRVPVEVFVQPEVAGVPENLVLTGPPPGESVTVTGPTSLIEAFKSQSVKARLDARSAHPGVNRLPLLWNIPDSVRGKLQLQGPEDVRVSFEAPEVKTLPVEVLFENAPPPGFQYKAPLVIPRQVKVSGRTSEVEKVTRLVASLDNADVSGAIERTVDVVAQDAKDRTVESVNVKPERVRVQLLLQRTPATKALLLSADLTGTPAPGFRVTGYRFTPGSALVSGDQTLLMRLSSLELPVSVSGLKQTTTRRLDLTAPTGATLVGVKAANVTIEVAPLPAISGGRAPVARPKPSPTPAPKTSASRPKPTPTPRGTTTN